MAKKVGRPTKFDNLNMEQVQQLVAKGFTDLEMANFFDVAESTWYLWKNEHPEFSEALKDWKDTADEQVIRSLFERAIGYEHTDTKFASHEGKISDTKEYKKHYPPETAAAKFWLMNRQPDKWRDKQEVEHSVSSDLDKALKRLSEADGQ